MINKQNRSKVFLTIIGILLVANIALVSFLLLKKDGDKHEKRPDKKTIIANFLKTEIGFDTLQIQQYYALSTKHSDNMKKLVDSLRNPKEKQFKELAAANFSDSAMNNMAIQSGASQKTIELRTFNHLKKIRLLCRPDQQPKFDSLFGKMLIRRNNMDNKKKPEGK